MCNDHLLQVAAMLAGVALALVLALLVARIDERRETRRRHRILAEVLYRHEQAQHFWRVCPPADTERRA